MADERYEWLDKDAAERLLRGEPVGPVGDHARDPAERLAAALDGVARADGHEPGELPGEAAAVAAFRKARAASPDAFSASTVRTSTVRIGRNAPAPVRWGRPVRLGLAGALAGVALGGVAVAAGTGVLPSPFGHRADPAPASSVSAAATPHPVASGTATGEPGGPTPDTTGIPGGGQETPGAGDGLGETGGTHDSSPGSDTGVSPAYPGANGDATPGTGDGPGAGTGDWYRKTAKACEDYRTGDLAPDRRRRLEAAAKGADRVERFCDGLLDGSENGSGDGNGDGNGNGGEEGGEGNGDDAGGPGGDKNGGNDAVGGSEGGDSTQDAPEGARRAAPPVSYPAPASPSFTPSTTASVSQQG